MQKIVMALVHCTSPHQDLSTNEVQIDTSYSFCVIKDGLQLYTLPLGSIKIQYLSFKRHSAFSV